MKYGELKHLNEIGLEELDIHIGPGCDIDDSVVVYPGTHIGAGCEIRAHSVLGCPSFKTPLVKQKHKQNSSGLTIGANCKLGFGVGLYENSVIGSGCLFADGVNIRENATVERRCFFGRYVTLNYNVHVGMFTRIMDYTHITGGMFIGKHVFISTGVSTANDNDIWQNVYETGPVGINPPRIEDYSIVGAHATLNPGSVIYEAAILGSHSLLIGSLYSGDIAYGIPAKLAGHNSWDWLQEHVYEPAALLESQNL